MTIDRAEIFNLAWAWTRADQEARWGYDWTPGRTYGNRRAATAAERRATFAKHLRAAWVAGRQRAAYREAQRAAFAKARPAEIIRRDILVIECKDRLFGGDWQALDALRAELSRVAA